ncbi:hypothetical protein NL676_035096 [Syzygium grande]|nr:hypothetical protein NL676_035096 [Syzygium grande]
MNNLRRWFSNRKSSGKSSSDENATQNKPPKSKPARTKPVLGIGTFGSSYKADLLDGTTTVMKRLRDVVFSAEDLRDKVEAIGAMDHENLLPLRGYYLREDEELPGPLSGCTPNVVPLSTTETSSRPTFSSRRPTRLGSPISALAPHKAYPAGWANPTMVDVYDFRVLLLEILTGKVPTQPLRVTKGVDLLAWVQSVAREESTAKVFYVELMRYHDVKGGDG